MQLRQQQGGDGRWFAPDRDMVYALPRLMRQALFVRFGGFDERTKTDYGAYHYNLEIPAEKFNAGVGHIVDLFVKLRSVELSEEQLQAQLKQIDPEVVRELMVPLFYLFLSEYQAWCGHIASEDPDEKLEVKALEVAAEWIRQHFAKQHAGLWSRLWLWIKTKVGGKHDT